MKKPILLAAFACALVAPAVTRAQLLIGGQAGLAIPFGDQREAEPLADFAKVAVPLELRVGWRLTPRLSLGLQGGWGWGSVGDSWDDACAAAGLDCGAHLWRVAGRVEYAFGEGRWRPFVAGSLGWEWLVERWEEGGSNWERRTLGGPALGLDAGVDLAVSPRFTLGAYVGLAGGVYMAQWVTGEEPATGTYEDAASVSSPALHGWATALGLRGTFDLRFD